MGLVVRRQYTNRRIERPDPRTRINRFESQPQLPVSQVNTGNDLNHAVDTLIVQIDRCLEIGIACRNFNGILPETDFRQLDGEYVDVRIKGTRNLHVLNRGRHLCHVLEANRVGQGRVPRNELLITIARRANDIVGIKCLSQPAIVDPLALAGDRFEKCIGRLRQPLQARNRWVEEVTEETFHSSSNNHEVIGEILRIDLILKASQIVPDFICEQRRSLDGVLCGSLSHVSNLCVELIKILLNGIELLASDVSDENHVTKQAVKCLGEKHRYFHICRYS